MQLRSKAEFPCFKRWFGLLGKLLHPVRQPQMPGQSVEAVYQICLIRAFVGTRTQRECRKALFCP